MPFVIDLDPVAFSLLGFHLRWYGIAVASGAAVAVWLSLRGGKRGGSAAETISDAVLWVTLAALLGGRLLYVIQNELATVSQDPAHLFMVWDGGLSFYGGLVGALLALAVFARRRRMALLPLLGVAAPAAAIGQAIGHVGCLIGGDSYGTATGAPWAVVYTNPHAMAPLGIPLHPTQAYEAILLAALFAALWLGRQRLAGLGAGTVAAAYLMGLAVIRFGLFFLRDEPAVLFGLKTAQLLGVGIALLALVIYVAARQSRHPTPSLVFEVSRP